MSGQLRSTKKTSLSPQTTQFQFSLLEISLLNKKIIKNLRHKFRTKYLRNQLQIQSVDQSEMEMEDTNSMAIGMHTNLHQTSAVIQEKQPLENCCSITMTQLTQASRTFSNHFSTPERRIDEIYYKRRCAGNLSYKRKIQIREMRKYKPATLPPITKKIKKRFDLTKAKTQIGTSKISQVSKLNPLYTRNTNVNQLTFSERVMLYDWLLQACEGLKLSRTVFHLTINLIEKISFFKKSNAQLVATSCLYTQSVLDDRCCRPIEQFEEITQGFITTTAIQQYQLKILKDQDWQLPRISIIDQICQILQKWDSFVLQNPKLIIPERSQKCMFLRGKFHIQNYVQFMAIIDSLKIMSIVNSKNLNAIMFSLLVVFVGLELGYSTLESLPAIRFQNHPPYQIIKIFIKQKINEIAISPKLVQTSLKKMYRCISSVMGILIGTKPCVLEEIQSVRQKTKPKFQFFKQFYFEGMLPI